MWQAAQGWPVWMAKEGTASAARFVMRISSPASDATPAQAMLRQRLRDRRSKGTAAELRAARQRNRSGKTLGISRPKIQATTEENPNMVNYPSSNDLDVPMDGQLVRRSPRSCGRAGDLLLLRAFILARARR